MMIKKIFPIINTLLATAVIFFCVKIFYSIVTANMGQTPVLQASDSQVTLPKEVKSKPLSDYKSITERNIFKIIDTPSGLIPPIVNNEAAPIQLNLKLWGTIVSGENSYAVIEDRDKREQNLYKKGDSVQGAIVKTIMREKVILTHNGQDKSLDMEDSGAPGKGREFASRSKGGEKSRSSKSRSKGRTQNIKLKRSQIEDAFSNMNDLMKDVRVRPHFVDGEADGLRISSIKAKSIFRRMGLRNGDVISAVDGHRLQSMDDGLRLIESLKSSSNMELQIKRRGRDRTIKYEIK